MATWLYQISPTEWSPERYRFEIWEGERWLWTVGKIVKHDGNIPQVGDAVVVFFCAPSGGTDPGFYGWAVVLEWYVDGQEKRITFRPTAPSDHLKMNPWWDDQATELADRIRGKVKQGTLWIVSEEYVRPLRDGVTSWLAKQNS